MTEGSGGLTVEIATADVLGKHTEACATPDVTCACALGWDPETSHATLITATPKAAAPPAARAVRVVLQGRNACK
jgi:hypothetical protein